MRMKVTNVSLSSKKMVKSMPRLLKCWEMDDWRRTALTACHGCATSEAS